MWAGKAWVAALVLVVVLAVAQYGDDEQDFAPPGPPDHRPSLTKPDPMPVSPLAERAGEQVREWWGDLDQAARAFQRGFREEKS